MTEQLGISTVIPTYNRAHLVTRAVESALLESSDDDEVIVVDDGSTDTTEEVLQPFVDRIRYERIENAGAGLARNRGIELAQRPLIAFLDSDDEWMPGKLELNRRLLQARPDVLFCFSDMAATTPDGARERNYLKNWHQDDRSWDEILGPGEAYSTIADLPDDCDDFSVHFGSMYKEMAQAPYISTITLVVRRKEAGEALFFEEDLPMYEDWLCIGRLCQKGTAAYLDVETAWNHAHPGARLTDGGNLSMAETRLLVLERLWGSDNEFIRLHGQLYDRLVNDQRRIRTASLISLGRTAEAREELRRVTNAPWYYRPLSLLPGPAARALLGIRRLVKSLIKGKQD